jgi:branched-chain amino acid transport system permease protein
VIGGIVYTFLDSRLTAWTATPSVQDLPSVLRVPLSEPLFVLGTLFILLVYFLPGGIVGAFSARPRRGIRRLEASLRDRQEVGVGDVP